MGVKRGGTMCSVVETRPALLDGPASYWQRFRCGLQLILSPHHDTHLLAPLPSLGVADSVDGFVFPDGLGGGVGEGVGVIGVGVGDEVIVAGAAVHVDVAGVEVFGHAAPAPAGEDLIAAAGGGEFRADGGEIRGGFFRAEDAEVGAHGIGAAVVFFDLGDDVEEAVEGAFGAGDDGGERGDAGGLGGRQGRGVERRDDHYAG